MRFGVIPTGKSGASRASFAKRYARLWRSSSNPQNGMMVRGVRLVTTSTSISASSVVSARRRARFDAIVETRVYEYHGEKRGDLYYTKPMLLANGERYEAQIAEDRELDSKYR